jgi:hypothetical protein
MEDPLHRMRSPFDRPAPVGFGFVAPHWQPRISFGGTYDAAWLRKRAPLLPDDFDPRFFQRGAAGLVSKEPPPAGTPVAVGGVVPHGEIRFDLPRVVPQGQIYFRSEKAELTFTLQTLLVDADASLLEMTFGAYRSVHGQIHDIECVAVGADGP